MTSDVMSFKQEHIPFTQARVDDFVWYVTRGTIIAFPSIPTEYTVSFYLNDALISFSFGSDISFHTHLSRSKPPWPFDTLVVGGLNIKEISRLSFKHFVIMLSQTAKFHRYKYIGIQLALPLTSPPLIAVLKDLGYDNVGDDEYVLNLAEDFSMKECIDDVLNRF